MMHRPRRALGIVAVAATAALVFSACSSSTEEATGPEKVTFWGSWSGEQVDQLEAQAAAFNDAQDEYEVVYEPQELVEEKLLTGLASGQVPDVILWDRYNTPLYVPKNALAPLDEYIEEDGVDLGQFYEQALGELQVDGATYGVPLLVDNRSLFYNKAVLDEAGLAAPTTWDELKTVAKAVTQSENGTLTRLPTREESSPTCEVMIQTAWF